MAQADAIEVSARELITIHFFLSQLLSFTFKLNCISHINGAIFPSELMDEIYLDTFLKKDQATLAKRGKESMAWVVRELWDYLQHECGEGEALPDNIFCDIMLKVYTCIHILQIPPNFDQG